MYAPLVLSLALFAGDQPPIVPAAAELAARVRALVVQLADPELQQREAAERSLAALGPPALPHLPAVSPQLPPEVRDRLQRVRSQLERSAVASVLEPSRVTLQGEMPVSRALAAIQQQTGNKLAGHEGRPGNVQVDLENALFWEALDVVLDQAKLDINPFGGQPQTLVITSRPDEQLERAAGAVYRGAFRLQIVRIEARRDLRIPELNTLRVLLSIAWEPRITPISLRQPLGQLRASDENGLNLLPANPGTLNAPVESGISAVELGIPLQLPSRRVQQISVLGGVLDVMVPGKVETFEFSPLGETRDAAVRKASVLVTFERWRKNLDLYEARLRVRYDNPGAALESHRGWIYRNQAYLLAAGNQRVANVGVQLLQQQSGEVSLAYLFDLEEDPGGYRFVYETPALIERVPVSYELLNIDLP